MANSTKSRPTAKPDKPHPDFPLFIHGTSLANYRWCKKVRGKFCYFGKFADDTKGDAALALWLKQKDDLLAGRTPRPDVDGLTVAELCDQFLNTKLHILDTGELNRRTFRDYHAACGRLVKVFGKHRLVIDLAADDFEKLRAELAKVRGPVALGNEIQRVRSIFKYALDQGLIEKPVRYGQGFKKPSRKTLRKHRAKNGERMLEPNELRSVLDAAAQPLKAMILLGVNSGMGQSDLAALPLTTLQKAIATGWMNYAREKTGVDRRFALWPETLAAAKEALETRPEPANKADAHLAFLTRFGSRWIKVNDKGSPDDSVAKEFRKLLDRPRCGQCGMIQRKRKDGNNGKLDWPKQCRCGWKFESGKAWPTLHRPRLGFYTLRHVFQTIGEEARDLIAVRHIMGHVDESMSGHYRERISDERLEAVTDKVHAWLYGG